MFDVTSLPISGGAVVAGASWALISAFGLGPMIADRSIAISGWPQTCEQTLLTRTQASRHSTPSVPDVSCDGLMSLFGPDGGALCDSGGDELFGLILDPLKAQNEQLERAERQRLNQIAELAPSRCACAANTVAADRVTWGLFAGSARLIGGPSDLTAELTQALHSPACAMRVEEGS